MATDQQFCLRWNNHQSTLISVFDSLLENGTLVDCTLAAEGQYLKAHKVVLSACSPYLEALLSQHYEKHPIVILKDVKFSELKSMMDYMYRGEVNISQDQLGTFLKAAESLQIKGLSDNGDDARDVGSTAKKPDAPRPSVTQTTRAPVESKRPAPSGDLSDTSRDGSISPSSLRKRRRTRRPSQGDDPDSNLDSNVCDLPSAQSTPMPVPSAAPVQNLPKQIVKTEPTITPMPEPVKKEILDPPAEPLLEPKTEYLDYMNNENSIEVEDLTLDDDDDEGLDSSMDASRPGPSHGDLSHQGGYPPWTMADQSGTDEIFMAAQEAVGAATQQQRDSQDNTVTSASKQRVIKQETCLRKNNKGDEIEQQMMKHFNELTNIAKWTTNNFCFNENNVSDTTDALCLDNYSSLQHKESHDSKNDNVDFKMTYANQGICFEPDAIQFSSDTLTDLNTLELKPILNNTCVKVVKNLVPYYLVEQGSSLCPKCKMPCGTGKHVCLFQCDLCPYTSEHDIVGIHKWREHKVGGKYNTKLVEEKVNGSHKDDKPLKCNFCFYSAYHVKAIDRHKELAHGIMRRTSEQTIKKAIPGVHDKNESKTAPTNDDTTVTKGYDFDLCSYEVKTKEHLRAHKLRKHIVKVNTKLDLGTAATSASKKTKENKQTSSLKRDNKDLMDKQIGQLSSELINIFNTTNDSCGNKSNNCENVVNFYSKSEDAEGTQKLDDFIIIL